MGISAIKRQENNNTNNSKQTALKHPQRRSSSVLVAKAPQNNALAGTGNPMNELVWRLSLLNLASRNAENTEIRNPAYGRMFVVFSKNAG